MSKSSVNISPKDFGKVAVLFGGVSSEREVSLISGRCVLQALLRKGVDAHPIDVGFDIVEKLLELRPDRAFIAMHGKGGEDGTIQGLLENMNIPYTGSSVKASAVAMDKNLSKVIFKQYGLPILPSLIFSDSTKLEDVDKFIEEYKFPICIKPVNNGSTIGVSKVLENKDLLPALQLARKYDDFVMLEPWIEGREFTVGILGEETLPAIEIIPDAVYYDYNAKYISNSTQFICPCDLSEAEKNKIYQVSLDAYNILGCRHYARVDFRQDQNGNFWLLEINTITGLTDHSLVPKAAEVVGTDYDSLIWQVLEYTLRLCI